MKILRSWKEGKGGSWFFLLSFQFFCYFFPSYSTPLQLIPAAYLFFFKKISSLKICIFLSTEMSYSRANTYLKEMNKEATLRNFVFIFYYLRSSYFFYRFRQQIKMVVQRGKSIIPFIHQV